MLNLFTVFPQCKINIEKIKFDKYWTLAIMFTYEVYIAMIIDIALPW